MSAGADAVVIGAGAAGIAAARVLHDAGCDVLLLEARNRVGGRARSFDHGGWTFDLGCGWLHSARRNAWTQVAQARGFTIATDTANWFEQWRDLGFPPGEQRAFAVAWDRWEAAARAATGGADRPLSAFIADDDPWRALIDAISGFANGAGLADVSLHDWLAYENGATEDNWALCEGYGTLVAGHAAGLDVRTATPVRKVAHGGARLRIETDAGTITTRHAIVAVPTRMLAEETIAFDPPLPDKTAAAGVLPLGVADKVFLSVAGAVDWPHDAHLTGDPHARCTAGHRLSPFGAPVIESYFGGECALALEDERAAAAFAIDELVALLGADWRRRLAPAAVTRWAHEPWIGGSYSHARVGHAGARQVLAAPVDDRLFFAGEACSPHDFSTAHGAHDTGVAAARALLAAMADRR